MGRLFLSGQTTCALLLGAGLLLRAQGAFRSPEHAAMDSAKTRPAEMAGERAARPAVAPAAERSVDARSVQRSSHKRKGFTHRDGRHRVRKCGVALANHGLRCT
ncbi:MAG: hypothetical protein AUG04_09010 [Deltaproteobacteria bacterium 13_1_20CM_2_69_21]|nr:MAG: hypothetical protein AUI90_09095 [Deltaproteobacteria bacterium 13_1_40CM_3_69_14]OLE62648.1 MAG: hypothetical protein AUG04_09010 [Deltaproteobacteria bacterium 13_1_20CM_2_69_21]